MAALWSTVGEKNGTSDASSPQSELPAEINRVFVAALRHHKAGRVGEATKLYQQITRSSPAFAPAWTNLGVALRALRRYEAAVASLLRAVHLAPEDAAAHSNLGNALRAVGRLDEAASYQRSALDLSPEAAGTHYNLGLTLRDGGNIEGALRQFQRAEELGYQSADLHWDRALAYLVSGDLERGISAYEWRWRLPEVTQRSLPGLPWSGESLKEQTIFVYAEQGFGDTIQFARYIPLIAERGCRVVFECQATLYRLFSECSAFRNIELIKRGDKIPTFDFHSALLTLPNLMDTTLSTIPAAISYCIATSAGSRPGAGGPRVSVGLAWTGKPSHQNDRNRSISLKRLAPILEVPDVRFVSLQVGPAAQEIGAMGFSSIVENMVPELEDFADTAEIIADIDLVITVDSAIAHLTGSLGRPVWTLVPYVPDWRWMLGRDDSPWYPSMSLMRQQGPGAGVNSYNVLRNVSTIIRRIKKSI